MNAIDLTTLAAVRGYLGLTPASGGSPVVATSIAAAIPAGAQTVTPATMANINAGSVLLIDTGSSAEYVAVTSITGTTFTATFALAHSTPPVPVTDVTDSILASMITGASQYWLTRTGKASLNSVGSYSERYDGSGSRRQFLRNTPILSVSSLQFVLGGAAVTISPSPDAVQPGFVIDQGGKSLALIGYPLGSWTGIGIGWPRIDRFPEGVQNIAVSYTAGFASTPFDVMDKVTQQVAVNYKRTSWIDQASQVLNESGTASYRSWEVPPEVERVIQAYTRRAIV
jgi:hypothetical protein